MSFFLRSRSKREARSEEPDVSPPTVPGFAHVGESASDDDNEQRDRWWYESSYELRNGLEVHHDVAINLPHELIDRMFKR